MRAIILLLVLFVFSSQLFAEEKLVVFNGETMGTTYEITLDHDVKSTEEIKAAIDKRLAEINQLMSTYIDDSEISKFNASDSTDWFPVSKETAFVVSEALRVSNKTKGYFDPTVLPILELWGFGKEKRKDGDPIPTQDEIDAVLEYVGFDKIKTQAEPPAIKKTDGRMQLDLSAIAKGYGVDQIAELLIGQGFDRHLVEIGGELRAGNKKRSGKKWIILIESPNPTDSSLVRYAQIENESIASSGNYRNFLTIDGKRYPHTIRPQMGMPFDSNLRAVSVVHEKCMIADAIATGAMAANPTAATGLAESMFGTALGYHSNGVSYRVVHSTDFPQYDEALEKYREKKQQQKSAAQMPMFIGAAIVFILFVVGMSVGVIFREKPIKGSCGAIAQMGDGDVNSPCDLCSKPVSECPDRES